MRFNELLCALALTASLTSGVMGQQRGGNKGNGNNNNNNQAAAAAAAAKANGNNNNNNNNNNGGNNGGNLALNPQLVQKASAATGQGADGSEAGQAASDTDPANFINFCQGKTLTNGAQVKAGSCNGIVMGDIPSQQNMISSIIVNPKPGDTIQANQDINFQVQTQGLAAGSFTNPTVTYYSAPQALKGGKVVGHTHVTVQDIGSMNAQTPPDPTKFAFFKGINDAGNGNGLLSATAAGGLPAGTYRVCTMTSASNHQPVLMPVAQRGAQDDCTKFTVTNGGGNNNNNNGKNNGNANANANANANNGKNAGNNGKNAGNAAAAAKGKGGKARRFAARQFIA